MVVEVTIQLDYVGVVEVGLDLQLVDEPVQQLVLHNHLLGDDFECCQEARLTVPE